MRNLFIFAMVKKDATKYIESHGVRNVKHAPSITYNRNANPIGKRLIGTDIDGAYWDIAFRMGIISENTYSRGLQIKEKHLLVASLSSLGRDKRYAQMREGKITRDTVIIKGNDDLKKLYNIIRYRCFGYMKQIAKLIGNDFIAYRTDCIYYLHTSRNVRVVRKFLESKQLEYKMVKDFQTFKDDKTDS